LTLDVARLEQRVLVLAPRGRDAELTAAVLDQFGFEAATFTTIADLIAQIAQGAGCAVLTQEALDSASQIALARALERQPAWSDFPLVVLVSAQSSPVSQLLAVNLGNVTVLERPLAPNILLTAVKAALRARFRQYEARAAIHQRDQFLAMLGHELRNPLAAIVLATQLARDGSDRAQLGPRLELIERQSTLLARLVDDLLDVARVTTGKVRLRREAVDIDVAIRSSISTLDDRARAHGVSVVFAATSGVIVEGDTVRIEQVLNNLLANAIKYSPSGRSVIVSSAVEGDTCVIRVRDQGIGVAPEMQGRVFDLFAQVDGSLERSEGGMGIGLTLVDRLVRLHGGRVELSSAGIGHGTELIVRLPIGSPMKPANVIRLDPVQGRGLRVVLVEDNHDLRALTSEILEALGCTVELATDGKEGLALIVASKPDLALVDIGLPIMDGYEVARQVRRALGHDPVLVAASGYGLEQDRENAHDAGFDLHITKPVDVKVMRDVLAFAREERLRRVRQRSGS
jgi:signal transduction histidine kinase/ActR/RegA family two-component response regulator